MLIGAYAIGAKNAVVYVRAEYPLAIKRLERAIEQATEAGYLGDNILGTDFSCKMTIKAGAGAFVCGEETAPVSYTHLVFNNSTSVNISAVNFNSCF